MSKNGKVSLVNIGKLLEECAEFVKKMKPKLRDKIELICKQVEIIEAIGMKVARNHWAGQGGLEKIKGNDTFDVDRQIHLFI